MRSTHVAIAIWIASLPNLSSMQLKISCITEVADFPKIEPFFQLHPSNDLITNCFLQNFVENKHLYFQQMAALTTSDFLSVEVVCFDVQEFSNWQFQRAV